MFEDGTEFDREQAPDIYHAPVIENKELDTLWYSQYFASQGTIISGKWTLKCIGIKLRATT